MVEPNIPNCNFTSHTGRSNPCISKHKHAKLPKDATLHIKEYMTYFCRRHQSVLKSEQWQCRQWESRALFPLQVSRWWTPEVDVASQNLGTSSWFPDENQSKITFRFIIILKWTSISLPHLMTAQQCNFSIQLSSFYILS